MEQCAAANFGGWQVRERQRKNQAQRFSEKIVFRGVFRTWRSWELNLTPGSVKDATFPKRKYRKLGSPNLVLNLVEPVWTLSSIVGSLATTSVANAEESTP
jgi:hypothetical protein